MIIKEFSNLLVQAISFEKLFMEEQILEPLLKDIPLDRLKGYLDEKTDIEKADFWFAVEGALRSISFKTKKKHYSQADFDEDDRHFLIRGAYNLQIRTTFEHMTEIAHHLQFIHDDEPKFHYLKKLIVKSTLIHFKSN